MSTEENCSPSPTLRADLGDFNPDCNWVRPPGPMTGTQGRRPPLIGTSDHSWISMYCSNGRNW